jgi:hypothetical protein
VQLITNGNALDASLCEDLISAGLDECAISLHTMNPNIYYSLTGLRLEETLNSVIRFLHTNEQRGWSTQVCFWRIYPPKGLPRDSEDDITHYNQFVMQYPRVRVLGPSEPWSRDGAVENSVCATIKDDPDGVVWCHKIFFTFNIAYNGDIVLCCNDYHRLSCPMGNVFVGSNAIKSSYKIRDEILFGGKRPALCFHCRRWRDTEYDEISSLLIT